MATFASSGRRTEPERMDDLDVPQAEVDVAFRFIRRINRWLGGAGALVRVLERESRRWPRDRPIRWLDLATGAADIPLAVDRWAQSRGFDLRCTALDHHPACLTIARAAVRDHPRIEVVDGNAFALDAAYPSRSFDYVHAGMFLHHLADDDVVRVLRSMRRLAAKAVVWNDLVRSPLSRFGIRCLTAFSPAIVKDDARLSVEKGFTIAEAREAARWAGLEEVEVRRMPLAGRFVLIGR
jgi:hypothetical protein